MKKFMGFMLTPVMLAMVVIAVIFYLVGDLLDWLASVLDAGVSNIYK